MALEFNEEKIREELVELYEEFLENPEDEKTKGKLISYDWDYGGASYYDSILKKKSISDDVIKGLNVLSLTYQYGFGFQKDEDIVNKVRDVLKELEENL